MFKFEEGEKKKKVKKNLEGFGAATEIILTT